MREVVQFALAHTVDAAAATYPEITVGIIQDLEGPVVEETVIHRVAGEVAIFVSQQTAIVGADPKNAVGILVNRPNIVAREICPTLKVAVVDASQAAIAAQP